MHKQAEQLLLAFDFGMKRIGCACGHSLSKTTNALQVIPAKDGIPVWGKIDALIKEWQPDALLVGLPLNMDGSEQLITHCAKKFANRLQDRYSITVHKVDERLSTREAKDRLWLSGGKRAIKTKSIDCVAAQIILETWFSKIES